MTENEHRAIAKLVEIWAITWDSASDSTRVLFNENAQPYRVVT